MAKIIIDDEKKTNKKNFTKKVIFLVSIVLVIGCLFVLSTIKSRDFIRDDEVPTLDVKKSSFFGTEICKGECRDSFEPIKLEIPGFSAKVVKGGVEVNVVSGLLDPKYNFNEDVKTVVSTTEKVKNVFTGTINNILYIVVLYDDETVGYTSVNNLEEFTLIDDIKDVKSFASAKVKESDEITIVCLRNDDQFYNLKSYIK